MTDEDEANKFICEKCGLGKMKYLFTNLVGRRYGCDLCGHQDFIK
jgi:hypothetical protein